ncbi:MAG: hypothetical protein DI606_11945 [Sphingobium sp.]|uniref:hypothetical protein n=1 Tax=Sphingobium sp. TaxID=1912891 RepID=UPI000DB8BA7B|nr:hypothetical protein [Sphingobium sp.]PZU11136.1 MAG: hypothetical protein DI606_11945 [Sphingobium sp.]
MNEERVLERSYRKKGDGGPASTDSSPPAYYEKTDSSNRLFLGLLFGALISVILWAIIFALGWTLQAVALGVGLCATVMVARLFRRNDKAED